MSDQRVLFPFLLGPQTRFPLINKQVEFNPLCSCSASLAYTVKAGWNKISHLSCHLDCVIILSRYQRPRPQFPYASQILWLGVLPTAPAPPPDPQRPLPASFSPWHCHNQTVPLDRGGGTSFPPNHLDLSQYAFLLTCQLECYEKDFTWMGSLILSKFFKELLMVKYVLNEFSGSHHSKIALESFNLFLSLMLFH